MDWDLYFAEFLNIIVPREETVIQAFQELLTIPKPLLEVFNHANDDIMTWLNQHLPRVDVEDSKRAETYRTWMIEMHHRHFGDLLSF